jgi:hypothetical protein
VRRRGAGDLLPRERGGGRTIVLVATVLFGLVWLLAPSHGLIAGILARRRAMPMESGSPVVLKGREAHIPDGR